MSLIQQFLPEFMIALGILFLITEIAVLGFSVVFLLFIGLSLIITGGAMYYGLLPQTLITVIISNAFTTAILTLLLWKPFKLLQNNTKIETVTSDFHGHQFIVDADIDKHNYATYQYSGISWHVKSKTPISKGSSVTVVDVEVGVFWVECLSD